MSKIVAAYADGGVLWDGNGVGSRSTFGGGWAWVHVGEDNSIVQSDSGFLTPRPPRMPTVTNNVTELLALCNCILNLPEDFTGTIHSDSRVSLGRVFECWKMDSVPDWLMEVTRISRKRITYFETFQWQLLDGHPTKAQLVEGKGKRGNPVSEWNCWCDAECGRVAEAWRKANEASAA